MGVEIERKYLVSSLDFLKGARGVFYRQGYLYKQKGVTVRVRISDEEAWLTIKGPTKGVRRDEFEYPIPKDDAENILATLCRKPIIEKTRFEVQDNGKTWEIDVFEGENKGLVVAEIELDHEDETVSLPGWVSREVSDDKRYTNAALCENPYSQWGK